MKFSHSCSYRTSLLLLVLIFLPCAARADALDDRIRSVMSERHIPGAAVAVIRDGRVVRMKGYGVASLEFGVPVTTETVFEIGSVSKQMTAAGIMLLVQDGKVKLDERISKYLPDTPGAWKDVTVRNLLTHTSGIKSYSSLDGFGLSERMTVADFIKKLSPHPLEFTPGEKNIYSNSGYNLLAYIIETQSGRKYIDFMREKIFLPLGMTKTRDRDPQFVIPLRASGYEWNVDHHSGRDGDLTDLMGAGSIVSTIEDMAKWEAALRGDRFLNPESKAEIWKQFTFNNGKLSPYGLGWRISDVRGHKLIGHTGQTAGFGSAILRYVDNGVTAIALTNLGTSGMGSLLAVNAAKAYIPTLSLNAVNARVTVASPVRENLERAVRGRYANEVDVALFTPDAARRLSTERARSAADRLAAFAPVHEVRIVKEESVDGEKTFSVIAKTERRIYLWRAVVDAGGKISLLELDEEE